MSKKANEDDAEAIRQREARHAMAEMKSLAEEIGKSWKWPRSALEILDEDRR